MKKRISVQGRQRAGRPQSIHRLTALVLLSVLVVAAILSGCSSEPEEAAAPEVSATVEATEEPSVEAVEPTQEATPEQSVGAQVMLPEMAELYNENDEIYGFITIEDTEINYPVMYTPEDGQFYLYRTFEKEEDPTKEGCLFVDEFCSVEPRDTNLLIHGHNMKNGTMFHDLLEYKDEDFYKEHPVVTFSTLYEQDQYEIAYVFLSKVYNQDDDVFKFYKFYNAANEQEFNDYTSNCAELELYSTGVEPTFGDELITLTTCEYSTDNGRMVVVARKVTDDRPAQSEYAKQFLEEGRGTQAISSAEVGEAAEATQVTGDLSA